MADVAAPQNKPVDLPLGQLGCMPEQCFGVNPLTVDLDSLAAAMGNEMELSDLLLFKPVFGKCLGEFP